MTWQILEGNALDVLKTLPTESVHCIVTSPPYWGLRKYDGVKASVWGGKKKCKHRWVTKREVRELRTGMGLEALGKKYRGGGKKNVKRDLVKVSGTCRLCGAWRGCLGLEPTPELWLKHLLLIFAECYRVLRKDGTLWVNIGSSYCCGIIESSRYVIRRGLGNGTRRQIAQAMSAVWCGHASPESAMQTLLAEGAREARELHHAQVQEMRDRVHSSQITDETRAGEILLKELRTVRKSDEKEGIAAGELPSLQQGIQQAPVRDSEESRETSLLLGGVLVQLQPERQSLSVGRRPARTDESSGCEVAQGCDEEGQAPLPDLPCDAQTGSSSHPSVRDAQGAALDGGERRDSMPRLSCEVAAQGGRSSTNPPNDCGHPCQVLEDLAFPKSAIPGALLKFCEPESVWKPKDLLDTPAMLAEALRGAGWYFRQEIIWFKRNAMPESVYDRPTKAHEKIFLFAKSRRYFYDSVAIEEKTTGNAHMRGNGVNAKIAVPAGWNQGDGSHAGIPEGRYVNKNEESGHRPRQNASFSAAVTELVSSRNRRSVWDIPTTPFNGNAFLPPELQVDEHGKPRDHFAVFPLEIPELCILAGTSEKGCCAECGAPWERVTGSGKAGNPPNGKHQGSVQAESGDYDIRMGPVVQTRTTGWKPTCKCGVDALANSVVLDPFCGAATVGLVATRLGRSFIGIEASPIYCIMGRNRIESGSPLFNGVESVVCTMTAGGPPASSMEKEQSLLPLTTDQTGHD